MEQYIGNVTSMSEIFYTCLYWAIYVQCDIDELSILHVLIRANILAVLNW